MELDRMQRIIDELSHLYPDRHVIKPDIEGVEARLGVALPQDLKLISSTFSGGYLGGIAINAFVASAVFDNIGDKTIELRQGVGLPVNFVVLAEPPASLIVMKTGSNDQTPTKVYWLAAHDVHRLVRGEDMIDYDEFDSFTDFVQDLLNREEEERNE